MERFDQFSSIEQAAMEQSPAHETDVRHNFMAASGFIDKIKDVADDAVHAVAHVAVDAAKATADAAEEATPETPEVAEVAAVAAGGVIVEGVFTQRHAELLRSVNRECSVDELIDLRNSLIKANRALK